jgi:hypothetical protein
MYKDLSKLQVIVFTGVAHAVGIPGEGLQPVPKGGFVPL